LIGAHLGKPEINHTPSKQMKCPPMECIIIYMCIYIAKVLMYRSRLSSKCSAWQRGHVRRESTVATGRRTRSRGSRASGTALGHPSARILPHPQATGRRTRRTRSRGSRASGTALEAHSARALPHPRVTADVGSPWYVPPDH
jgi:hypothetical protein